MRRRRIAEGVTDPDDAAERDATSGRSPSSRARATTARRQGGMVAERTEILYSTGNDSGRLARREAAAGGCSTRRLCRVVAERARDRLHAEGRGQPGSSALPRSARRQRTAQDHARRWSETLCAPRGRPTGGRSRSRVYYQGEESIWTVGANGSGLRQVAHAVAWPDWSPDGKRIIFTDRLSVWTMAPGGNRRRRLTPPVLEVETLQATFSPDGRQDRLRPRMARLGDDRRRETRSRGVSARRSSSARSTGSAR